MGRSSQLQPPSEFLMIRRHRFLSMCVLAGLLLARTTVAALVNPGDLLVSEPQNGSGRGVILDVNPVTGAQTVVASGNNLDQPEGICWDPSTHTILVADYGGVGVNVDGAILRIDPLTGMQSIVSIGGSLNHPVSVVMDANGQLVVAQQGQNQTTGAVLRIDPATGAQTVIASGSPLFATEDLVLDADGNYLVSDFASPSAIIGVSSATGSAAVISHDGALNIGPHGLWLDNTKPQSVLVADYFNGAGGGLLEVNTVTGAQNLVSSNDQLVVPLAVTQDSLGTTYVTTTNASSSSGKIVKVDLTTGVQTVISSGNNLVTPASIIVVSPEPATALGGVATLLCVTMRRRARST
jgi:sugar lactone lactonase YvrE